MGYPKKPPPVCEVKIHIKYVGEIRLHLEMIERLKIIYPEIINSDVVWFNWVADKVSPPLVRQFANDSSIVHGGY